MKNGVAIAAGIGMMLAALYLSLGTLSQDQRAQPELARELGTALHSTPVPTPVPTLLPTPRPPVHITGADPTDEELVRLLFELPGQQGRMPSALTRLNLERIPSASRHETLVVTGTGRTGSGENPGRPLAFASVLYWQAVEYRPTFQHVLVGQEDVVASYRVEGNWAIFNLDAIVDECDADGRCGRLVIRHSCNVPLSSQALWRIHENPKNWQEPGCQVFDPLPL